MHGDEPDGASANAEAPSTPAKEAATPVDEPSVAKAPGAPEVTPQASTHRAAVPSRAAAQRKKGASPPTAAPEPAPVETPPPATPVAIEPAAPVPVTAAPPAEPPKVERAVCADSSNPFSREACLWEECAKPEFRSRPECARFTGPGGRR
jgi:hypothetical protein